MKQKGAGANLCASPNTVQTNPPDLIKYLDIKRGPRLDALKEQTIEYLKRVSTVKIAETGCTTTEGNSTRSNKNKYRPRM